MRRVFVLTVVVLITAFFWFDFDSYLTLDSLQDRQRALTDYVSKQPAQAAALYFLSYVSIAALSLPGASLITLLGGALFGVVWGSVLVSFASTIGACLAFIFARYLFRDMVDRRFGDKMQAVNEGIEKEGAFYLFGLRLIPLIPYFVVNLLMGLTKIRLWLFFIVSQLGMLPATVVYVNAGTQLAKLSSLSDVLSAELILSFAALGLLPFVANKILAWYKTRALFRNFSKPQTFERNLVVIGAGSGGLVSAYISAAVEANVTLIEKQQMGGDCLNFGCVPSKALIRSAKAAHQMRTANTLGIAAGEINIDFARAMARVHEVIARIAPHDSVARYTDLGVECVSGEAQILDPFRVKIGDRVITTRNIILATGGHPYVPPIEGLDKIKYLTSDTVWDISELPTNLVVVGGGPIGCELSQAFARLGSKVTLVQRGNRIMPREDPEVSAFITKRFEEENITVLCNYDASSVTRDDNGNALVCTHVGGEKVPHKIAFDQILFAVGRKARTNTAGIDELGIALRTNGTIKTDPYLRTNYPNIFACGDSTGPYQFTHVAAHQAWYAAVNALFSGFKQFKVDYSVIPWSTFTDPEVARVGLNESEAVDRGVPFELTTYGIDDLDRAITDNAAHGFVKVLTVPGKDKILGVTIVAEHAGDLIAEFVLAMRHNLGLNKILGTIHIYPTYVEANKYAAGQWRQAHKPKWAMRLLKRFHRWRLH